MKISVRFRWYDLWIGAYYAKTNKNYTVEELMKMKLVGIYSKESKEG